MVWRLEIYVSGESDYPCLRYEFQHDDYIANSLDDIIGQAANEALAKQIIDRYRIREITETRGDT